MKSNFNIGDTVKINSTANLPIGFIFNDSLEFEVIGKNNFLLAVLWPFGKTIECSPIDIKNYNIDKIYLGMNIWFVDGKDVSKVKYY